MGEFPPTDSEQPSRLLTSQDPRPVMEMQEDNRSMSKFCQ